VVVVAGGPLGAWPAALLVWSRLGGALAGRLGVTGTVGGALLGTDSVDGRAGPLAVGPLAWVARLRAKRPIWVDDVVAAPVVLDLGGGLTPGPPTPSRLRHRTEGLQDIAGPVGFDGQAGGAALPGEGPHHLPVLGAQVGVGLQPALAALLMLAQLPLVVMGPVGLLGGHDQPTRYAGSLLAAARPAKHPGRLAAGGRLVGGQGCLGVLAVGGGPGEFAAAVAGGLVELLAKPVPLGPQLTSGQPLEIGAVGDVDGQGLVPSSGQGLGQLQVGIRLLSIR